MKWIDNNLRNVNPSSTNPQKLSKHNQAIRRPQPHFVGLALKGLRIFANWVNVNGSHELRKTSCMEWVNAFKIASPYMHNLSIAKIKSDIWSDYSLLLDKKMRIGCESFKIVKEALFMK